MRAISPASAPAQAGLSFILVSCGIVSAASDFAGISCGLSVEDGGAAAQERRDDARRKLAGGVGIVAAAACALGGGDRPARVGVDEDEVGRRSWLQRPALARQQADAGRADRHPVGDAGPVELTGL